MDYLCTVSIARASKYYTISTGIELVRRKTGRSRSKYALPCCMKSLDYGTSSLMEAHVDKEGRFPHLNRHAVSSRHTEIYNNVEAKHSAT